MGSGAGRQQCTGKTHPFSSPISCEMDKRGQREAAG